MTNSYDANGRLAIIADPSRTYVSGMQYLGKGNSVSQMTLGNGTLENYTLNDRMQMTGQELKKGSDVLQKYNYGYGQINEQTGVLDTKKNNRQLAKIESFIGANKQSTQKFLYDHLGRLKESSEYRGDNNALTYKQKFDFDRFGNLYRKTVSNPTTGQQNPLPYTPIEETTTPGTGDIEKATNRFRTGTTYDDAENVVTDGKFRSMNFAYDANGRQIKATRASVPDAWTVYDASGNRVATKINDVWQYMVFDAFGKLVAEYCIQSESLGGVKYLQQDWQGSVRTVTNNNGFVVARTDHQAFGGEVGYNTGQRSIEQGYSADKITKQGYGMTERDDATGLDHTWFRKNENKAGRWTSPDPYNGSMSLANPQSFNRYSYVQGQPTNFVDPSGLNAVSWSCYITWQSNADGSDWHITSITCSFGSSGGGGGGGNGGTAHTSSQSTPAYDADCIGKKLDQAAALAQNAVDGIKRSYSIQRDFISLGQKIAVGITAVGIGLDIIGAALIDEIPPAGAGVLGAGILLTGGGILLSGQLSMEQTYLLEANEIQTARNGFEIEAKQAYADCLKAPYRV